MKMTKSQLKGVVKECLIEILAEGMGPSTSSSINEVSRNKLPSKPALSTSTLLRQNASKIKTQSAALREAIRVESGGNDVMASILADTAEKTLPAMLENDRSKIAAIPSAGGTIERVVAAHDPQDLFGEEAASKWADLAFMGPIKK